MARARYGVYIAVLESFVVTFHHQTYQESTCCTSTVASTTWQKRLRALSSFVVVFSTAPMPCNINGDWHCCLSISFRNAYFYYPMMGGWMDEMAIVSSHVSSATSFVQVPGMQRSRFSSATD